MDHPRYPKRLGMGAKTGLWLVVVAVAIAAMQLFGQPSGATLIAALVGLAVGAIVGFTATANVFSRHVLVAGRFVDRSLIEARLRQLGA
ncbi:hypothetical protein GCM10011394_00030 [Luteimonas terricola]|uniref:Uncharacterized protein n=2 Tax=Luteimonas terricola TaxID=645597 RepID=A0ABQ2E4G8_9GAMM|nr:hypothetical protein GCM10011394_00030 [Luteimonas terricola]